MLRLGDLEILMLLRDSSEICHVGFLGPTHGRYFVPARHSGPKFRSRTLSRLRYAGLSTACRCFFTRGNKCITIREFPVICSPVIPMSVLWFQLPKLNMLGPRTWTNRAVFPLQAHFPRSYTNQSRSGPVFTRGSRLLAALLGWAEMTHPLHPTATYIGLAPNNRFRLPRPNLGESPAQSPLLSNAQVGPSPGRSARGIQSFQSIQ